MGLHEQGDFYFTGRQKIFSLISDFKDRLWFRSLEDIVVPHQTAP